MIAYVVFDLAPVPSLGDGSNVVSIAPELTFPELLSQFGEPLEELLCRDGLKGSNDITATVLRMEGAEYVDMILVTPYLFEPDVVSFGDLRGYLPNCFGDRWF